MAAPYGLVIGCDGALDWIIGVLNALSRVCLLIIPWYQKSSCFLITRCDQCSAERSVDDIFDVEKQLTEEIEVSFNNKQRMTNFVVDKCSFFLLPGNLFDRNRQVPAAPGEVHRPAASNPLPGDK